MGYENVFDVNVLDVTWPWRFDVMGYLWACDDQILYYGLQLIFLGSMPDYMYCLKLFVNFILIYFSIVFWLIVGFISIFWSWLYSACTWFIARLLLPCYIKHCYHTVLYSKSHNFSYSGLDMWYIISALL